MGVPMLGRARGVRQQVVEGDLVLLDGDEAIAFARPTPAVEEAFETKLAVSQKRRAEYAAAKRPAAGHQGRRPHLGDGQCRPARRRRRSAA